MNTTKNYLQNRLKTKTLDCLMQIAIEGPNREGFDFEKVAEIWPGKRNRRLV